MEVEIIKQVVNLGVIGCAFWVMLRQNNKQQNKMNNFFIDKMEEISKSVKIMSLNIGKTQLSACQAVDLFKAIMLEHIERKLDYAREVLEKNHIEERRPQIEKNLMNKFKSITMEEAEKLSSYNSVAGDMGKILLSIDFDQFMSDVYDIFFEKNNPIPTKITDLRLLMRGYVNDLLHQIDDNVAITYN